MKKVFFILLLFLFSKEALIAQNSLQKVTIASFEGKFSQVTTRSEKRIMYAINMNLLETEALKASFVNRLYASKKIAVVSRINSDGVLMVSAPASFPAREIEAEILSLKNQPAPEVAPSKY